MIPSLFTALVAGVGLAAAVPACKPVSDPQVTIRNGTYRGTRDTHYHHEKFLGMPYAQPPVGSLRFRPPQSLNSSWDDVRNATAFSPMCIGYGSDTWVLGNYVSEDCLKLNVVRPKGVNAHDKLPVAVWIHGGAYQYGSSSDPRYNLSYVVAKSEAMGQPIVAVSLNYRLQNWGFMFTEALAEEGSTNVGYRDQRLAMHWVQENIAAFGGDPRKVTVFGESAGSMSIATHLVAYGGRDDHLFRSAIMQSGSALPTLRKHLTTADWQPYWVALLNQTSCTSATNAAALQCLRAMDAHKLSNIFNSSFAPYPGITAAIDGDFLTESSTYAVRGGKMLAVPIIMGTNTDEGTAFGTTGIDTDAEFIAYLKTTGLTDAMASRVLEMYPDDPAIGIPKTYTGRPTDPWGAQFKRVSAYRGDYFMTGPRRLTTEVNAGKGADTYSYDFDVLNSGIPNIIGSTHFQEIPYMFNNTLGAGFETAVATNPLAGKGQNYFDLVDLMSRMWVSFVNHMDPNQHGVAGTPIWPKYTLDKPQNIVFNANVSHLSYVEDDTYRAEGMKYIVEDIYA
ncbi:hypothetical protein TD95_005342 [Thielaviopsis punctulata]|uniref:Carboxylic ester hydrolase n=1 Tax=Thielaviopsis punctulata TaxID=72032 RepID=A0A0F4ZFE9_9PEZI|nr:hypothetical protein TD95_005342 [Thielaviopsis punctulata]